MQAEFGDRIKAPGAMTSLIDDDRLGRKNGCVSICTRMERRLVSTRQSISRWALHRAPKALTSRSSSYELAFRWSMRRLCVFKRVFFEVLAMAILARSSGLAFLRLLVVRSRTATRLGSTKWSSYMKRFEQDYGERFTPAQVLVDAAKNKTLFSE